MAYMFANPNRPAVEDDYTKVRAENDWTSKQVKLPVVIFLMFAAVGLPRRNLS